MLRGQTHARLERGQIVPDVFGRLSRYEQWAAMQIERVDHHEIVGEAEVFNVEFFRVDHVVAVTLNGGKPRDAVGISAGSLEYPRQSLPHAAM